MRTELKRIEIIERYLQNEFNEKEKADFEDKLRTDSELKAQVEAQRDLMEAIKRQGQRQSVEKAKRSYQFQKSMKWILPTGLLLLVAAVFLISQQVITPPVLVEIIKTEKGQNSPIYVPAQEFQIENKEAVVLEGRQGIVLAIPKEAFEDDQGNLVTENVKVILKEALDAESILQSGLSTMADSTVLETAGMFELTAKSRDKDLRLRKGKEILVNVPTDKRLEGMKLYDGEKKPDGTINWVNPKPMENYLIPEDIFTLNFYRRGFLDSLHSLGKDTLNKVYVDSLFYSFYCNESFLGYFASDTSFIQIPSDGRLNVNFKKEETGVNKSENVENGKLDSSIEPKEKNKKLRYFRREGPNWYQSSEKDQLDSLPYSVVASAKASKGKCSLIWPADIKAFWNEEFQGSNLATREFESRMKFLTHKKALDVYIQNLNKPLYYSDSLIANGIVGNCNKEQFKSFYARMDGRVKANNDAMRKLASYYNLKRKIYAKSIKESQEKFWKEQSKLDGKRLKAQSQNNSENLKRNAQNLRQEFNENLKEAYKQIGVRNPANNPNKRQYRTTVRTLGWKNLDRRQADITYQRRISPRIGEKMKIKYNKLKVEVEELDSYDRIYCYLVSTSQFSFIRMLRKGDNFEFRTNEFFNYKMITVAYKDKQAYFGMKRSPEDSALVKIDLKQISRNELAVQLKAYSKSQASSDIIEDLKFEKFLEKDNVRVKVNVDLKDLKRRLQPLFTKGFPDCDNSARPILESNAVEF